MAAKKKKSENSMDTGTKVILGLLAVALLIATLNGSDGDDDEASADAKTSASDGSSDGDGGDDPWTRGPPPDDGDDDEVTVVDDPWTRGPPPDDGDDDDDEVTVVDDPWTRGAPPSGGGGLPACRGIGDYPVDEGVVALPIDSEDDAFASADCTFARGQSDESVLLLQAALSQCNGRPVAGDGIYGPDTRRAVAALQAEHGLTADGGYGPDTREAMSWPTRPGGDDSGAAAQCAAQPDVG
jgi:hypothetical protein